MLLAIDAGNTNVCFSLFQGTEQLISWRASSELDRTEDDWAIWFTGVLSLHGYKKEQVQAIMISSVVPHVTQQLRHFCHRYFSVPLYVVGEGEAIPPNQRGVEHPAEVGTDLLMNTLAAHTLYKGPLFVLDFGTATTLSKVDPQGNFCGVLIAPGLKLSLKALYQATAKLPNIEITYPRQVIGNTTIEAMQSGIFWGYLSMVEGLVRRAQQEHDPNDPLKIIATGGIGVLMKDYISAMAHYDVDLTLKGLQIMYERLCTKHLLKQDNAHDL